MEYAAHSDPFIRAAFWAGLVALVLTVSLLLLVALMRLMAVGRELRTRLFFERWRAMMARSLAGDEVHFPDLEPENIVNFLQLWLHYQQMLRGESKITLNRVLHSRNIESQLRKLMNKGNVSEKLLAITALGYSQDNPVWESLADKGWMLASAVSRRDWNRQLWDDLGGLARDAVPLLSITAARALVMIDPVKAVDVVIPLIISRRDWPPGKLAMILNEADPDFLVAFLAEVSRSAKNDTPYLPRLLALVESMQMSRTMPFIRTLLEESLRPEVIAICLKMLRDPRDLDMVRRQLDSAEWTIRVQVAAALGRMGVREDLPRLMSLMCDREWWVRYRAAQALISLPFMRRKDISEILLTLQDRFAVDILQRVLAEKEVA